MNLPRARSTRAPFTIPSDYPYLGSIYLNYHFRAANFGPGSSATSIVSVAGSVRSFVYKTNDVTGTRDGLIWPADRYRHPELNAPEAEGVLWGVFGLVSAAALQKVNN